MSEFLFAYGTLQPGLVPADIAPLVARLKVVGEGAIRGILYDVGHYAGAIPNINSQHTIYGTVLELPEAPDVLPALDAYEEFDPSFPETSLYVRMLCPVTLTTGDTLQCWVYAWNGDPANVTVIPSGRFRGESPAGISE